MCFFKRLDSFSIAEHICVSQLIWLITDFLRATKNLLSRHDIETCCNVVDEREVSKPTMCHELYLVLIIDIEELKFLSAQS